MGTILDELWFREINDNKKNKIWIKMESEKRKKKKKKKREREREREKRKIRDFGKQRAQRRNVAPTF